MIVYEHALHYCWWPVCTVSSSDMLWRIVLFSTRISLFDTTVLTLLCRWRAGQGISRIYTIYLFTTLLCIYLFYIQYFEIVPLTPNFMSDPRFVSFIVYVDNSRVLSTSSPESGVEAMHSRNRLWSTEPTCRCVYISVVYSYHMTDCIFSMKCILRYYSVPIMYWPYIICFHSCISYCISFIYSVHVYPDYYILSLRLWACCR